MLFEKYALIMQEVIKFNLLLHYMLYKSFIFLNSNHYNFLISSYRNGNHADNDQTQFFYCTPIDYYDFLRFNKLH